MTEPGRGEAGALLRQFRRSIRGDSGSPLTQEELAEVSRVGVRTIQRLEAGDSSVGNKSTIRVFEGLSQKGLDSEKMWRLENAFNPVRTGSPASVDRDERAIIRENLRGYMLDIGAFPGFVMDEYFFIRVLNVHILALHQIEPRMLHVPELWHAVGMKLKPELKMKGLRGPKWQGCCLAAVKEFHLRVAVRSGTERYRRVMQWLMGMEDFRRFWRRARREAAFEDQLRVVACQPVPVYEGSTVRFWNEVGGSVPVSRLLPAYWRCLWAPAGHPNGGAVSQALVEVAESAERLGYDVKRHPFVFVEDYVSQEDLRTIGGWIE